MGQRSPSPRVQSALTPSCQQGSHAGECFSSPLSRRSRALRKRALASSATSRIWGLSVNATIVCGSMKATVTSPVTSCRTTTLHGSSKPTSGSASREVAGPLRRSPRTEQRLVEDSALATPLSPTTFTREECIWLGSRSEGPSVDWIDGTRFKSKERGGCIPLSTQARIAPGPVGADRRPW